MASVRQFQMPVNVPPEHREWVGYLMREILDRFDARSTKSDFAAGVLANADGSVTLGTKAFPTGRTASVAALTGKIGDTGRAADQRFLWPVNVGSRNSVQSASGILTSTSTLTGSTVNVAGHSIKYDFGSVTYNAGSISGLNVEQEYLIYCHDPDFQGGAVTYLATQDPAVVIETGNYYVGSISTAVSPTTATVDGATSADPIEVTTLAAHGWKTGDAVSFADMPGDFGTNLNGNSYSITKTAANKFRVAVDGHLYTAYTSGGTATRVTNATAGGAGAGGGAGGVGGYRWSGTTL